MQQLRIPFQSRLKRSFIPDRKIVRKENNDVSQAILQSNEMVFRGQCKIVIDALLRGEKLTVAQAMIRYRIGDLRRRIKDLRDIYGIKDIQERTLSNRFKEWWID